MIQELDLWNFWQSLGSLHKEGITADNIAGKQQIMLVQLVGDELRSVISRQRS